MLGMTVPAVPRIGGYLRSLYMSIRTYGDPPRYDRPRSSADRTRSRHARAGSRRTKRHGLTRPGPAGWPAVELDYPAPWGPIELLTGADLYGINQRPIERITVERDGNWLNVRSPLQEWEQRLLLDAVQARHQSPLVVLTQEVRPWSG